MLGDILASKDADVARVTALLRWPKTVEKPPSWPSVACSWHSAVWQSRGFPFRSALTTEMYTRFSDFIPPEIYVFLILMIIEEMGVCNLLAPSFESVTVKLVKGQFSGVGDFSTSAMVSGC